MKNLVIVTCDKIKFFECFPSLEKALQYLENLNHREFDGNSFYIFGPKHETDLEGRMTGKKSHLIDSVVLCPKGNPNIYYTFLIRAIDRNGNRVEIK